MKTAGKRLFDLAIAVPALLVSLPVQAIVAVLVVRDVGRPVLFRQVRPGLNAIPFELVKFRSMHDVDAAQGWTDDRSRITPLGATLRATSLDEMPTLWNVVRGDMSLVGPRPLMMLYLERYTTEQSRRHQVRPGITGLAQVSGRNALPWDEKLALDVEYIDHQSLRLDIKIILATVAAVLRRRGISSEGQATTTEFLGSTTETRNST